MVKRATGEQASQGENQGPNVFEVARGGFNNAILSGSYDGPALNTSLQALFANVGQGLKPTDRVGRASRYGMVSLMCQQAADLATTNGDELSAAAYRSHQDTFGAMSELLGQPKPSAPLPSADAMQGVKS